MRLACDFSNRATERSRDVRSARRTIKSVFLSCQWHDWWDAISYSRWHTREKRYRETACTVSELSSLSSILLCNCVCVCVCVCVRARARTYVCVCVWDTYFSRYIVSVHMRMRSYGIHRCAIKKGNSTVNAGFPTSACLSLEKKWFQDSILRDGDGSCCDADRFK